MIIMVSSPIDSYSDMDLPWIFSGGMNNAATGTCMNSLYTTHWSAREELGLSAKEAASWISIRKQLINTANFLLTKTMLKSER